MSNIEPIPWRGFRAVEKIIIVLLVVLALAVAVLPFLDKVLLRRMARLSGGALPVQWLAGGGTWLLAGGVLLALLLFVLWRRQKIVGNRALWFSTGCPNCGERELVRVSRHFGDRFYNMAAVPAYRYACRNCTWRGLRVGRRERSLDHEAELEAALLRFDPDAPLPGSATGTDGRGRARTVFRDSGDVDWDETEFPAPAYASHDDTPDSNHAEDDPLDEMEWIWQRPSGTDQV